MEFQKYKCDDNFIMECGVCGDDLDLKDELTKIKYKLMNELKKMDTNFKNINCVITNDYDITNDAHTVDTHRGTAFRIINEKDILKTFDELYHSKMNDLLEWNKSDIEEFKGEHRHKDKRLKDMSYSKVINRGFNITLAMNNKCNNWFLNLLRDIFNLVLIYRMGNTSTKTTENN